MPGKKTKIVGIGAGGHARVIVDAIRQGSVFEVVGFVDANPELRDGEVAGVKVLGTDRELPLLFSQGIRDAFMGVGAVGYQSCRRTLYESTIELGFEFPCIIHPRACVAEGVKLGKGVVIMAGAIVNVGTAIGDNVVINSGAIVEHDCVIDDHVHIASGAILAGGVQVGAESFVGAGAVVRQQVFIGERAIVGAGSVVIRNVSELTTVVGNPAKFKGRCLK